MQVTLPKVILVLRDTIEVKERYLTELETRLWRVPTRFDEAANVDRMVDKATVGFLRLNINELKAILKDLELVGAPAGELTLANVSKEQGD